MSTRLFLLIVALGLLLAADARAASDPVPKCRRAVVLGAGKLAHARLVALRKCEDQKRVGKRPALGACRNEPDVAAALAGATAKLAQTVARACGGADRRCGDGDDVGLAAMEWPTACPELEGQGCGAPLASCADVPACVACLVDAAVARGVALVYAPFAAVDPKTEKAIARCQKALAGAATGLADTRIALTARCLAARLAGKHAEPCPGTAAARLVKARAKAEAAVCQACGGADKRCGGDADLARELVGIAPACPGVGTCEPSLATFADVVACFDCTAAARGDCALAAAAPGIVDYPPACALVPATPTPTVTPTPTETPVASPTRTATPEPTPSPVFCPAAAPNYVTTTVTITLASGGTPVGGADLVLEYDPARVRLPGVGDDAAVRARVTDLTAGALLNKGSPTNQDHDGDREPDRVRFTVVSTVGVTGAILTLTFDRCSAAAITTAADYTCTVGAKTVGTDGATPIPGAACTLAVTHAP